MKRGLLELKVFMAPVGKRKDFVAG